VEEGCVDLDPLSCPQAAESDGTGKPETTGTTCTCSVDSYVTGEGGGANDTRRYWIHLLSGACLTVTFCRIAGLGRGVRSTECRTKYVHIPVLFFIISTKFGQPFDSWARGTFSGESISPFSGTKPSPLQVSKYFPYR